MVSAESGLGSGMLESPALIRHRLHAAEKQAAHL